jgi:hypothetical protein
MNQRILANLGFLLQTAGLLTLLPIAMGFIFNQTQDLIPTFITCTTFLDGGFFRIEILTILLLLVSLAAQKIKCKSSKSNEVNV